MMSSVIGGAMLPHAPQFFTMPETEDRNTVERVKTAAAEIGTRLRTLRPDLWIIFGQRPCGAVLPHCGTALYDPCRRRGKGRVRWSPISLARAGRDRVRDRAPNVRSGFRPGLLQR